jgi:hypothetical protein
MPAEHLDGQPCQAESQQAEVKERTGQISVEQPANGRLYRVRPKTMVARYSGRQCIKLNPSYAAACAASAPTRGRGGGRW